MMDIPAIGEIIRETKTRPYSMLILVALTWAVPYLWFHTAWAQDLSKLKDQIAEQGLEQKRNTLESRLQAVDTDLFNLKQKVKEMEAVHKDVDSLNYDRINSLEIEKSQLERVLAALR
jgi:septal ring factor EnvC (AmiA/AmiB activator)